MKFNNIFVNEEREVVWLTVQETRIKDVQPPKRQIEKKIFNYNNLGKTFVVIWIPDVSD
jgi:exonuclease III